MTTTAPVASATIDRNTAQNLNAMIGIHAEETLESCELAMRDLGYILSVANSSGCSFDSGNLFRLFEVITRAMRYEIETMKGEQA